MKETADRIASRLERLSANASERNWLWRYSFSSLLVIVAFAIRQSLEPILHEALPFTFFVTSSTLAAYFGGAGPGFFALFLGWLLADYFFVPPIGSLGGFGKADFISLVSTLGPSLFVIIIIQLLHRARHNARTEIENRKRVETELIIAKEQLESINAKLEWRVAERTADLEKSVKFLDNFCYSIAHDLRAPLRAMQGFTAMLEEDYTRYLDKEGNECGQRIIQACQRMDKLILDLLEYGRLNHQRVQLEDVGLDNAIQHARSKLEQKIADRNATLLIKSPLTPVRADAALLNLVFYHLIDNALKFTPLNCQPRIEISTEEMDGNIRILVRDNGIGIDPQYQQRIFRLFETLRPINPAETGVGLALVMKAAERMNGRVGVSSEQGKGSTFWIELPKADRAGKALPTEPKPRAIPDLKQRATAI
ncbi:MAG: domain S-box [Verrucomicrobiales bacterium]|nr:domain S-box [Verrucomicrobiales bacterium]